MVDGSHGAFLNSLMEGNEMVLGDDQARDDCPFTTNELVSQRERFRRLRDEVMHLSHKQQAGPRIERELDPHAALLRV